MNKPREAMEGRDPSGISLFTQITPYSELSVLFTIVLAVSPDFSR